LYNGKYHAHIWKVTVIFSLTGAVLGCRFDFGTEGDSPAFQQLVKDEQAKGNKFEDGPPLELCFADGAYGTANPIDPHLLTPFNVHVLRRDVDAVRYNTWHCFYRARAEHGIRRLKTMRILKVCTLPPPQLFNFLAVAVHVSNAEYRRFIPSAVFDNPPPDSWETLPDSAVRIPVPHADWEKDVGSYVPVFP